jgi:hypothetical protein
MSLGQVKVEHSVLQKSVAIPFPSATGLRNGVTRLTVRFLTFGVVTPMKRTS